MAVTWMKRATRTPASGEADTRARVEGMLEEIEAGGEAAARRYAETLDGWSGEIVVPPEAVARAGDELSPQTRDDIRFAWERVRRFAEAQRASLTEFEAELSPGLVAGQRLIPVETAGCYIPGGRYAHIASAIMSVTTAKAAGVSNVIACSPPRGEGGVHPAILYTAKLCGADTVLALGGVQGVAALAFGLFTGHAADLIVGPGNRFVAEAKRALFGRVGIDLFAGPTEILVVADGDADPDLVACDLVSQAEHGPDSPAWADQHVAASRTRGDGPHRGLCRPPRRAESRGCRRSMARLWGGGGGRYPRGSGGAERPVRARAPGGAGGRPRLVAGAASKLRLALPRGRKPPLLTATRRRGPITFSRLAVRRATRGA